ncbi:MurR/RpiR family transcriptional regulator [Georgenia faecalis]|uniref:MurR/RpiR family transcriptional regulator n=1 Tax=Georgenia faecalis TaxID=2483799 RepID=A0ABV9DC61_9MICO|nr:MurR/RpiR family transcriptional regulator [Georgenia faecalis]
MNRSVLDDIREMSASMSAAKRAVGDFILANWRYSAFLNAAELAAAAHVSESVVVRFAKELGLRGYPELQDAIRTLVMEDMGILGLYQGTTEDRTTSIDRRIQHSMDSDAANLTKTIQGIDAEDAEAAARLLNAARQVAVIGSRTSRGPASIATIYLNAVLANTRHFENTNSDVFDQLRVLDERDVVLAFILRHYNRDTVAQVKFARERGAKVIVVTDSFESPLVRYADYVFYAQVGGPSFYLSHVSMVAVVNVLLLLVATLGDADRQAANLADLEQIYDSFYYSTPVRKRANNSEKPVS